MKLLLILSLAIASAITISSPSTAMAAVGAARDSGCANSAEVEELARFAVQEHNKKQNALLEFVRVVKAKEQVVAGTMHHLTVEAIDAGKKKLYEAKVWVKPWLNFRELQDFTHAGDSPSVTPADLGANKENVFNVCIEDISGMVGVFWDAIVFDTKSALRTL